LGEYKRSETSLLDFILLKKNALQEPPLGQRTRTRKKKGIMTKSTSALLVAIALLALLGLTCGQNINNNTVPYGSCFNETQDALLLASTASPAQFFTVNAAVPFETFWNFFSQANLFPTWNSLFVEMQTTDFYLCGPFDASYSNTPKINFPAGMTAPHDIVQVCFADADHPDD